MAELVELITPAHGHWLKKFGDLNAVDAVHIDAVSGVATTVPRGAFHAEAQFSTVLGADFIYSAAISMPPTGAATATDVHLQFRISDEGRYGVGVKRTSEAGDRIEVRLYRYILPPDAETPDRPEFFDFDVMSVPVDPLQPIPITIETDGSRVTVTYQKPGTPEKQSIRTDKAIDFGVGRFGVYVYSRVADFSKVSFAKVRAATNPVARSNFALLYNTVGYDLDRANRAILRTLNDIPPRTLAAMSFHFDIRDDNNRSPLVAPARMAPVESQSGHTLGFQAWVADFSRLVTRPGRYRLTVSITSDEGDVTLRSDPILVQSKVLTNTVLKALSIRNGQARRAADDDFRRNWAIEAGPGAWTVGVDGAFVADQADDGQGAILRRLYTIQSVELKKAYFRFVARVSIIDGCDAQLQFGITSTERWGVTLQAGAAGGCRHGGGPGAVRLHRETAASFDPMPEVFFFQPGTFKLGHPYDVEIRVDEARIVVLLDGVTVITHLTVVGPKPACGAFALKAWASTARFEHVQVWARDVPLSYVGEGVWLPYTPMSTEDPQVVGESVHGLPVVVPDSDPGHGDRAGLDQDITYPYCSQHNGFQDCNNFIGEATSHGVFLAGLMDVWSYRAAAFRDQEREALRDVIVTAVLYLFTLHAQARNKPGAIGQFVHQATGRATMGKGDIKVFTMHALYGLSSFAALGLDVDRTLARQAYALCEDGLEFLDNPDDVVLRSIVLARLASAASVRNLAEAAALWDDAAAAANEVLSRFSKPKVLENLQRECLRSIPWFEGAREVFRHRPGLLNADCRQQLEGIASQLKELIAAGANGLQLVPQATDVDDTPGLASDNWRFIDRLPRANRPVPVPVIGHWYVCEHFVTAAIDCACIGAMLGSRELEPLATGSLSWVLGINPGVPTTKTATTEGDGFVRDRSPWRAASLIFQGPGVFARTIEGNRQPDTLVKKWVAPWEESATSRHREMWIWDPLDIGFQSIVNGYLIVDDQWHYWSVGGDGWVSAETFMLIDGSFLKAAIAVEDWVSPTAKIPRSPYDTSRFTFLDTTHTDRLGTTSPFDFPDTTAFTAVGRALHDIATRRGFRGAVATGHHIGERVGAVAVPAAAELVTIAAEDVKAHFLPFQGFDNTHWAKIAKAAMDLGIMRGFTAAFFTGHVRTSPAQKKVYELVGVPASMAAVREVSADELPDIWRFDNVDAVGWAFAARAATAVAAANNLAGGFFTGRQHGNDYEFVGFRAP